MPHSSDPLAITYGGMLDTQQLTTLYELYSQDVYHYCYRRLHDHQAAEDCQQMVFVALVSSLHHFEYRGRELLQAWLYTISHNVVVDYVRKEAHRPTVPLTPELQSGGGTANALCERMVLWQAIEQLTPQQRRIVHLRFILGLPTEDVARITGRSEGSVKLLQHRALRRLHDLLEEYIAE